MRRPQTKLGCEPRVDYILPRATKRAPPGFETIEAISIRDGGVAAKPQ